MMLDSNIVIGYLNGDETIRTALHAWREKGTVFFISHVSVVEALSYPSLTQDQISRIEDFLGEFIILPIDMDVARRAGLLRRTCKLSLPDSMIVATAIANHLPLVTRDKKLRAITGIILADI